MGKREGSPAGRAVCGTQGEISPVGSNMVHSSKGVDSLVTQRTMAA
jgi:hypothetical protein